jgi:hypothetical protein
MVTARQAKPTRMPGPPHPGLERRGQKGGAARCRRRPARSWASAASRPNRERDAPPRSGGEGRLLESLLSKLENNRANPSINMLHRLASALGTNLTWLVAPSNGDDHAVVLRRADRPTLHAPAQAAMERSRYRL